MRYLGLDVGRATVGLALADDLLRTARALRTLRRSGDAALLQELRQVVEEFEVTQAVVGLPLHMDGSEGDSARLARGFARKLEETLHLPVALQDERLSTFEAEGRLRAQGLRAREQREVIDAEAAAVILQGWLDARVAQERPA